MVSYSQWLWASVCAWPKKQWCSASDMKNVTKFKNLNICYFTLIPKDKLALC